jgi:hypothetical protein
MEDRGGPQIARIHETAPLGMLGDNDVETMIGPASYPRQAAAKYDRHLRREHEICYDVT